MERVSYTSKRRRKWWQLWKPREWEETNFYYAVPGAEASRSWGIYDDSYLGPFSFHTQLVAGQWQPIETAPRDGTVLDLWDGERRADFHWHVSGACPEGIWLRTEEEAVCARPTHWMPLPEPPAPKIDRRPPTASKPENRS